jgi:septal ring factor EnvC (AmiA/AmiB activator)
VSLILVVIIVKIVFIHSFLFYWLLCNYSFKTNPNTVTNLFKHYQLHCSCVALDPFELLFNEKEKQYQTQFKLTNKLQQTVLSITKECDTLKQQVNTSTSEKQDIQLNLTRRAAQLETLHEQFAELHTTETEQSVCRKSKS